MKKYILFIILIINGVQISAQRSQLIAYVDMDYILENIPEYIEAQNTLDAKVAKWRNILDKQARHIEVLKSDLANEKPILTKDLIEEKEEEITIEQEEFRRLESLYFGPNGDLFQIRKELVKPIQDQVYNAIQSIVKARKYDFVFEKSSDLILLYSNKKYDISELVLKTIDRTRLANQKQELRNQKKQEKEAQPATKELTEVQKKLLAKKEADLARKEAAAEKRKELLKQRAEKKRKLREQKEAERKKKLEEQKKEKTEIINQKNNN